MKKIKYVCLCTAFLLVLAMFSGCQAGTEISETVTEQVVEVAAEQPETDEEQETKEVAKTVEESEEEIEDGKGDYISMIPFVSLTRVDKDVTDDNQNLLIEADSYDVLADSAVCDYGLLNSELQKYSKECADRIDDMCEQILQVYQDNAEAFEGIELTPDRALFGAGIEPAVTRLDEVILSVREYVYIYTGGARPSYGYNGYTFDVKTGKILTLDDIFENKDEFLEFAQERFLEILKTSQTFAPKVLYKDYKTTLKTFDGTQMNWFFDSAGMIFVVNPDTIAPYAVGEIILPITYEEMTPYIKDSDYLPSVNDSISYLINGESGCVSLTKGLYVTNVITNEEEEKTVASIAIGDKEKKIGENLIITDSYIVNRNEKTYMLLNLLDDNQRLSFRCYDITDGSIKEIYASDGNNFDADSLTIDSFEIYENAKGEKQTLHFDVDIQ